MTRWKASAAHLAISVLVVLLLAASMGLTWYPPDLVRAVGGLSLIGILAGVDVCLGPLLTLIVWDVKKPMLKLDMTVIALVQLLALGYGIHTAFLARPVYLVFAVDRFEAVTAAEIPDEALAQARRGEFRSLPLTGPEIVAAQRPTDTDERNRLLFSALSGGADLPQMPQYYVPYAEMAAEAARRASPLAPLLQRDAETRERLSAYLAGQGLDPSRTGFLPLRAKRRDQAVLVDQATGAVRGIVDVDPW